MIHPTTNWSCGGKLSAILSVGGRVWDKCGLLRFDWINDASRQIQNPNNLATREVPGSNGTRFNEESRATSKLLWRLQ